MIELKQRRQRRRTLTDKMIRELRIKAHPYFLPDPELPSHGVRVQPTGGKAFYVVKRDAYGKLRWVKLGSTAELEIEQARAKARAAVERLKQGLEPFEPPAPKADSVAEVAASFFKRHVEAKGLRSGSEKRRIFEKYILPVWGERTFTAIGRLDIARLCDAIEDKRGRWVADSVLAELSSLARWYATRHDTYQPPFVRGMRRVDAQQRKRQRLLSDDEIRTIWRAAGEAGSYGALLRVALITGQRREKLCTIKHADISDTGVWTISRESAREKGTPGALQLPPLALDIIRAQPRFASNGYVFAGRGSGPLRAFSVLKAGFDKKLPPMPPWTVHDLRRTARSLMTRAGVRPDVGEAVLGHRLRGVEGVYDVYGRQPEMSDALRRLAALIERIISGEPGENVVPLRA